MPLVGHTDLPTYSRLSAEGRHVLSPERAAHQDIRELHIGFLNMMPDAALEAAERQFFRLVGESNRVAQIYMHPFTLPVVTRGQAAKDYFARYYEPFEKLQKDGLDALIITGASEESNPHVSNAEYWKPLKDVIAWAHENVASTLCSCLASHAALTYTYGQEPGWREDKRFGVFPHRVVDRTHPLVSGMNTVFNVPHARHSEIDRDQFVKAGMRILAESDGAGVHTAVSPDGFRLICFQGHPEYDTFSLLKEYRREIEVFRQGGRPDYPTFPEGYFTEPDATLVRHYQQDVEAGRDPGIFPEDALAERLENTWRDSARSMIAAWIGLVYQTTHMDRRKLYMDGIDPANPLGL